MTDEQIVRALECCGNMKECKKECPLGDVGGIDKCIHTLMLDALELIKRQQAEIEELQEILGGTAKVQSQTCAVVRVKAVREFAKRLKEKATSTFYEERKYVDTEDIDELVRKMTEKEGGAE